MRDEKGRWVCVCGRSRMTIDPGIPTMHGERRVSTDQAGIVCTKSVLGESHEGRAASY